MVLRLAFVFAVVSQCVFSFQLGSTAGLHNHHMVSYSSAFWPFTRAHAKAKTVTEADYQQAAAKMSDEVMMEFAVNMLKQENKIVLNNGELAGFVQWFSGTKAVQTLEQMKAELATKDWVQTAPKALGLSAQVAGHDHALVSEMDYQDVAALKSDEAMTALVVRMLDQEDKVVTDFGELAGLVQWFSGTKSVQTLAQLRQELATKEWVQSRHAAGLPHAEEPKTLEPVAEAPHATTQELMQSRHVAELPQAEEPQLQEPVTEAPNATGSMADVPAAKHAKKERKTCYECFISSDSNVMSSETTGKSHVRKGNQMLVATESSPSMRVSEPGTYWLLHTEDVQIQGRFLKNSSNVVLGAVAVSGFSMGGNTLTVRSWNGKVQWNEDDIMMQQSHFSNNFMHARFKKHAKDLLTGNKIDAGLHVNFANGLSMVVNRFMDSLAVSLHMCTEQKPAILEGHCTTGFFQGNAEPRSNKERQDLSLAQQLSDYDSIFID